MDGFDPITPMNAGDASGGAINAAPAAAPVIAVKTNPTPAPNMLPEQVPHARLFNMLQGLGVALSATGKALATHGREGGAQDVAAYEGQQQEMQLKAEQEKRAQNQDKRQQQEAVDVHEMRGAQTALVQMQTHNMLTKLPDEMTELHAKAMNEMSSMYEKAGFAPQIALAMAEGQSTHDFMGSMLNNLQGRIGQNSFIPQYTDKYGSGQGQVNIGSRSSLGQVQLDKAAVAPTLNAMGDMIDHAEKMGADPKVIAQARGMLQPIKDMPEGSKINGAQYQDLYMMVENRLVQQVAQKKNEQDFQDKQALTSKNESDAIKAKQEAKVQPIKDKLDIQGKRLSNQKESLDIQKTGIELKQLKELSPDLDPNLVGDAYLAKLPHGLQETVQAIKGGRMELSARMLQTDRGQRLAEVLNRAIPGFDASKAPAYFATRKDFTSGETSKGIENINTALGHVGQLFSVTTSSAVMPGISDVARSFGMTNAKFFEYKKNLVTDEIQHAWTHGALTDLDKKAADQMINEWTPSNARQGERALTELLMSRAGSINNKWQNAKPSPETEDFPVLSPESVNVVKQVLGKDVQRNTTSGSPAAPASPKSFWDSVPGAKVLPGK